MPNEPVVEALEAVWDSIIELGSGLTEDQWNTQTCLPGWSVKDNISHLIGTERTLAGFPPEEVDQPHPDYVKNGIGEFNEASVALRRSTPGADVIQEFAEIAQVRLAALRAMSDDEMNIEGWTPIGPGPYRMFMEVRVFDCWFHEQDIREALGIEGHRQGVAADYAYQRTVASFPYVVGKRAGVPKGSTVALTLSGDWERDVYVQVDDKAVLTEVAPPAPTVVLSCDAYAFGRLTGGRWAKDREPATSAFTVQGDEQVARAIIDALDVVM